MQLDHALDLSRLQFAFTAIFHILWPILTISLSLFVFLLESLWLRTGQAHYRRHARYWGKLLALNFAVGVVSGIPMEFEFGTNWSRFSQYSGEFFGNILGFEGAMAFMLEAGFAGIMLYGWDRVPRGIHLFATGMVALGSSLSAFWIMVANSWMQTPAGVQLTGGHLVVTDYVAAIFNRTMPNSVLHMWLAAIETGLCVVAGLSAWKMLKRQQGEFFARSFKLACTLLLVVAPLQVLVGDWSGKTVFENQPAKGAAIEGHWETNAPGTGASWSLLAWPDKAQQRNSWSIEVPGALSLLATHSPTGTVRGLKEFAPEDQPPLLPLLYYAFRAMAGIGMWFVLLAAWTAWTWSRVGGRTEELLNQRWLLRAWVMTIPLPYLAVECGWIVREVGRQPWAIYGMLRTQDASSPLQPAAVTSSLWMFAAFYTLLLLTFVYFARRWLRRGAEEPAPAQTHSDAGPYAAAALNKH
ncbi:MAG: cytochrome ubiquinol oxidase subunit I [Burkholderiaceae bacterium]